MQQTPEVKAQLGLYELWRGKSIGRQGSNLETLAREPASTIMMK